MAEKGTLKKLCTLNTKTYCILFAIRLPTPAMSP